MRRFSEFNYEVVVVPMFVLHMSRPLLRGSVRHRGRILRIRGKRRGPVIRGPHGAWR